LKADAIFYNYRVDAKSNHGQKLKYETWVKQCQDFQVDFFGEAETDNRADAVKIEQSIPALYAFASRETLYGYGLALKQYRPLL
jgi:hypothetical protein